jgi:hypothetical protein
MRIKILTIWQNAGAGFPAKNRAAWPKPMPPADKNWLGFGIERKTSHDGHYHNSTNRY